MRSNKKRKKLGLLPTIAEPEGDFLSELPPLDSALLLDKNHRKRISYADPRKLQNLKATDIFSLGAWNTVLLNAFHGGNGFKLAIFIGCDYPSWIEWKFKKTVTEFETEKNNLGLFKRRFFIWTTRWELVGSKLWSKLDFDRGPRRIITFGDGIEIERHNYRKLPGIKFRNEIKAILKINEFIRKDISELAVKDIHGNRENRLLQKIMKEDNTDKFSTNPLFIEYGVGAEFEKF